MKGEVSIIIPAYNAEKYIEQTIDSVFSQTYQNWELIVIDDGSVDLTAKKIEKYLSDKRVSYYFQKNSGVSVARNRGISLAKGDYITFLDADDFWDMDNLRKKIDLLKKLPDIDWVFSDVYNADSNLKRIGIAPIGIDNNILENILLWEREVVPGPCSNIVMRRKCTDNGVLFDTELSTAADQDFTIQLAGKYTGKRIEEPLVTYRILSGSMSRNIERMERDHILVYKKAAKNRMFYSKEFKRKCFSNLYITLGGSWWVNGNNKLRGIYFGVLAVLIYPQHLKKIVKKLFR